MNIKEEMCADLPKPKQESQFSIVSEREQNAARMKKFRISQSSEDLDLARLKARTGMKKFRASQTNEEKLFSNIEKRQSMRELCERQTGKDHLTQNLAAKKVCNF